MIRIAPLIKILLIGLLVFSCGSKKSDPDLTPDTPSITDEKQSSIIPSVNQNIDEIIADLHKEIKILKAELNYQNDGINKIQAQSQLWGDPFSIYNKEVVLNNGSSIFGKIIYQDRDIMKIETLIGQLVIDRNTIARVVSQLSSNKLNQKGLTPDVDPIDYNSNSSGLDLMQKPKYSDSAKLVLVGGIVEEKDGSNNTILSGEVKNIGSKRADFAKIIFSFRMNWQGDSKSLTTFINGVTNTFDTGISSDNSILPHAIGSFELIIPKSFGIFIGYNYDFDWSQYDK